MSHSVQPHVGFNLNDFLTKQTMGVDQEMSHERYLYPIPLPSDLVFGE